MSSTARAFPWAKLTASLLERSFRSAPPATLLWAVASTIVVAPLLVYLVWIVQGGVEDARRIVRCLVYRSFGPDALRENDPGRPVP